MLPDATPFRRVFGDVCPACGGSLEPPEWRNRRMMALGARRCAVCKRLVVPAREGWVVEEAGDAR